MRAGARPGERERAAVVTVASVSGRSSREKLEIGDTLRQRLWQIPIRCKRRPASMQSAPVKTFDRIRSLDRPKVPELLRRMLLSRSDFAAVERIVRQSTENRRERKSPYAVVVGGREESEKLRANKLRIVAETKGNERAVKDEQTIEQEEPTQKFTLRE